MPVDLARSRGRAKRDLIAQASIVPKQLDESAERIRRSILALKNKECNEWEMVEAIHDELSTIIGMAGLTQLTAKLVIFQLHDFEARREMLDLAEQIEQAAAPTARTA